MSSKRMELNKMCFFVLSGVSNPLGKELAVEMCRRFKAGSIAMIIDTDEEILQEIRKEIDALENNIQVICYNINNWQHADYNLFHNTLSTVLSHEVKQFELAFIIHNEGLGATHMLMEPHNTDMWKSYIQQNFYTPIALNQQFIKCPELHGLQKLMININSSLWVKPLVFSSLLCSSKKARDMYFRSIAAEETDNGVIVMNYGPGIFDTHKPTYDFNRNIIDIDELVGESKILNLPRVKPLQSTLKLINILEEISFISGHDVDYYDTYVL